MSEKCVHAVQFNVDLLTSQNHLCRYNMYFQQWWDARKLKAAGSSQQYELHKQNQKVD